MKNLIHTLRLTAAALLAGLLLTALVLVIAAPAVFATTGHPVVFIATGNGTIEIPTAPLAVMTIAGFLSTYVISALNGVLKFVTKEWQRAVVSVVASVALGIVSLVCYYLITADPLPADPAGWVGLAFVTLVVCQASYNLVTKALGAKALERVTERAASGA